MPGGFVDAMESGEAAVVREVPEEVGLDLADPPLPQLAREPLRLFGHHLSHARHLRTRRRADHPDRAAALDAVESLVWMDPLTMPLDEIAFDSMRAALAVLRGR